MEVISSINENLTGINISLILILFQKNSKININREFNVIQGYKGELFEINGNKSQIGMLGFVFSIRTLHL